MNKYNILVKKLQEMNFVNWDRLIRNEHEINIYGWIKRSYKYYDFVVISYLQKTKSFWFITSSERYSETIHNILFAEKSKEIKHYDCERVENVFKGVVNCVKLEKRKD